MVCAVIAQNKEGGETMPFGDRRGPMGLGPKTGRGFGYCSGFNSPGYFTGPRSGRFFRKGFFGGAGRGWRHWYYATGLPGWARYSDLTNIPATNINEKELLKNQADILKSELEGIEKRLAELDNQKE